MHARARCSLFVLILMSTVSIVPASAAAEGLPRLVIEEVVTDPETDHDGSGSVTTSDEYLVLLNQGDAAVDLEGWRIVMEDSTPEEVTLEGLVAAGARHLIMNPRGAMNNDVHLLLYAPDGRLVADHALGQDGLPDGKADSRLEEAVHLAGPWKGLKAPATIGRGLPPFWLQAAVSPDATPPPEPFSSAWLPGGAVDVALVLHRAPSVTDPLELVVDGRTYPVIEANGTARVEGVALAGPDAAIVLKTTTVRVAAWPNGTAMVFPVDDTPPVISDDGAVMNATRHIHHVPAMDDDESGAMLHHAYTVNGQGNRTLLDPCMLPTPTLAATCPVPAEAEALELVVRNGAGSTTSRNVSLVPDLHPPTMPDTFIFETQTPPRFGWPTFSDPLLRLAVETSDDASGTWNLTTVALTHDATRFTDDGWTPGAARAYRLVATDRGGNTNATPWVALPPEAVPVGSTMPHLPRAHLDLLANGTTSLAVHFDRPLHRLPQLLLEAHHPTPFRVAAEGLASPDDRTVHYVVDAGSAMPRTAQASWRLAGGEGIDGAPLRGTIGDVAWDLEPPRIDVLGWTDGWIAGEHHVLTLSARDRGDPRPTLRVEAEDRDEVHAETDLTKVVVNGVGTHVVHATASDRHGNRVETTWEVRLDAAAPEVRLETPPREMSADSPLVLAVHDDASGVVPETLNATVRNDRGGIDITLQWEGDRVSLLPDNGSAEGPFEVRVSLMDRAGNLAEGLLGTRLTTPGVAMKVIINGTQGPTGVAPNATRVPLGNGSSEQGGHQGPTVFGPVTAWTDLSGPALPTDRQDDDGRSGLGASLLSGLAAAGAVGLGTAVVRRRRGGAEAQRPSRVGPVLDGSANRDESSATR